MPEAPEVSPNDHDPLHALCRSGELANGGQAVPFDVVYSGQTCRAFAVRFEEEVHAYLNRCAHVAMEMDWQPNRFFDDTGRWLLCATHGAVYQPDTGVCRGGPCRRGLVKIPLVERDGVVFWQSQYPFHPPEF
ncbi:Rieske 2Fe-2S domain-containing protein [Hydrogenophaga sp. PAMC20947]|uniref:Rieske (2Fe-2S) protein n=1 Tax=Hydrogenophaga sp. PAMC20947 TaxID=2565558 RepID=UPI00109DE5E8|nr:Rieske 2Fe-2S domain-containing protein [Hydrogenophaga sp. PAMC20947]QCB44712.1 Rieske (2Fe-2S) protein [Hydrogenophaga sp. PAMC20947]